MRVKPVLPVWAIVLFALIPACPAVLGNTFVVDSGRDSRDIAPGDGICADHSDPDSSRCSLRAALEEAAARIGADTIIIPHDSIQTQLSLGPLVISDDSTSILGQGNYPVVDGAANPHNADNFEITSAYNVLQGVSIRRARKNGITITGQHNLIGGSTDEHRNLFNGNGLDPGDGFAVAVTGSAATNNVIGNCFVGLYGNGTVVYGNDHGILLDESAHGNTVGFSDSSAGNIISGNTGYGVVIRNEAHDNNISGNLIGPDITGSAAPGNGSSGMLISGRAHDNHIGGDTRDHRNQISGNGGDGITLTGDGTSGNIVSGNFIGLNFTGWRSIANHGNGITINDGASYNTVGGNTEGTRNIISGNFGNGVHISDPTTTGTAITGNHIGGSYSGTWLIGGDTYNANGVVLSDGTSGNAIGGTDPGLRNVISANINAGILITGSGTGSNTITGNYVGVTSSGLSSASNGSGVVIRNGASHNQIGGPLPGEGNTISGNRADVFPWGGGVIIYESGSDYNTVQGNKIGTSYDGTRGLRNGTAGVIIGYGASHNLIGGDTPAEGNLISGNGIDEYVSSLGRGVHIFGSGTSFNRVSNNAIGLAGDSLTAIVNIGHGIGIFEGAHSNIIGGDSISRANLIVASEGHGVCIGDPETIRNSVRNNAFYDNDSLNIVIRPGAQTGVAPPAVLWATPDAVIGELAPPMATVDVYLIVIDSGVYDKGIRPIASGLADENGLFYVDFAEPLAVGDSVTIAVTDTLGNSSALSQNVMVAPGTSVEEDTPNLPEEFSLGQNYPNPFNPTTAVPFALPVASEVTLTVYNVTGQVVAEMGGAFEAGEHAFDIDGSNLPSGVYFYRLDAGTFSDTRKMLLIK